jgi:hypothetical protein
VDSLTVAVSLTMCWADVWLSENPLHSFNMLSALAVYFGLRTLVAGLTRDFSRFRFPERVRVGRWFRAGCLIQ